jgi:Tfp pilus assembly protein PilO
MAGIMLELDQVAGRSQVALRAVTPQQQTITGGVGFQPVEVVLVGRFGNVTKFLRDVKRLVDVRRERLAATGRLFSVESVQLKEAQKTGFPNVEATVRVPAYVCRGGAAPAPADAGTTAPADGGEELNTAAGVNP